MMSYRHILFEADDKGIARITVNRPDKRNALSSELVEELRHAFEHGVRERSVRALIVTGSGEKAFVAGAASNGAVARSPAGRRQELPRRSAPCQLLGHNREPAND